MSKRKARIIGTSTVEDLSSEQNFKKMWNDTPTIMKRTGEKLGDKPIPYNVAINPNKMPYKHKEIEKRYFTIREVAKKLNVATSLLRFWEEEFDQIHPKKNKKGNRQYSPDDVRWIGRIYHLVKVRGFQLWGARKELKIEAAENISILIAGK